MEDLEESVDADGCGSIIARVRLRRIQQKHSRHSVPRGSRLAQASFELRKEPDASPSSTSGEKLPKVLEEKLDISPSSREDPPCLEVNLIGRTTMSL